jgi:cysteinyl-tRNA synthetase
MRLSLRFVFLLFLLQGCSEPEHGDINGEEMQGFVKNISAYARSLDPDFIIIPQNGPELAFNDLEPSVGMNHAYLDAIDGMGIEELFYDGSLSVDEERLDMLRQLKAFKKVLVSDYVTDPGDISDAIRRNQAEGFICFPREADNYDYTRIPISVIHENEMPVRVLQDARNYLYLIGTDSFQSKKDMIDAIASSDFDLVLTDLFFNDSSFTASEVMQMKTKSSGAERLVISYINIGAAENFRYYWKEDWKLHEPDWLAKPYEGYEDEIWVNYWDGAWQDIIYGNDGSYMKKIVDAGFDGAYLDNTEAYYFLLNDE